MTQASQFRQWLLPHIPSGLVASFTQTTSLIGLDDLEMIKSVTSHFENKPKFASAPAAICVLTQHVPGYDDVYFNVQDYSAAIENMLLAITALGYASCWIEGEITWSKEFSRKVADTLGVAEGYELVAYLPVGIPAGKGARVKRSLSMNELGLTAAKIRNRLSWQTNKTTSSTWNQTSAF